MDSYIEEYRARGASAASVAMNTARLERWGRWLKARRPRVAIERIDAESITLSTGAQCLDRRSQGFLCGRILKHPGASAADAADGASSIHQMKSDTEERSNNRLTIAWRARDEERFLLKNLSGYEGYCQVVRYRLVPFAW